MRNILLEALVVACLAGCILPLLCVSVGAETGRALPTECSPVPRTANEWAQCFNAIPRWDRRYTLAYPITVETMVRVLFAARTMFDRDDPARERYSPIVMQDALERWLGYVATDVDDRASGYALAIGRNVMADSRTIAIRPEGEKR